MQGTGYVYDGKAEWPNRGEEATRFPEAQWPFQP